MHEMDGKSRTVQVWQFSSLRVLRTFTLPPGPRGDEQYYPGQPRLLDDGKSLLVHTFNCGLYLMRGVDSDNPSLRFVYGFPGSDCGVPLRIGHWWLATVPETHSLTVLDISDPEKPREVSRVTFDARQKPHWVAADLTGTRIVLNSDENGPDHRLFIVNFDPQTAPRSSMKHSATAAVTARASAWTASRGRTDFMAMPYAHGTVFPR
jgi:hypothetical protein